MVGSLMAKVFECMIEPKVSAAKLVRELMDKLTFENTVVPSITLSPFEYQWKKVAWRVRVYIVAPVGVSMGMLMN